ncbi:MAG: hypothetical protein AUJ36_02395 [Parcubacteria group bacterium CG1_02_41_26]|nr:MAG: hypothetical protein AUJ36_02395 [Parcubacteria group bacterium CG1_02_41_26]
MLYIFLIVAGFFGGVVRGLVGFVKHQFSYKNVGFDWKYFLGMSFISGVIGLMAAISIKEVGFTVDSAFTPALSFIIGYAGGDFLENIYKIIAGKGGFAKNKE